MARWLRKGQIFLLILFLPIGMIDNSGNAEEFDRIAPETLKMLIERSDRTILIVDVRPKEAYGLGHIKGAINFPWAQDLKSHGDLPQNKTLILYCDCGQEEDSLDMATQMKEKWDYAKIKLLQGGWSKWKGLGYPIEK